MIVSLENKNQVSLLTGNIPNFDKIKNQVKSIIDLSEDVQKNRTNLQCKMTDWKLHLTQDCFKQIADAVKDHVTYFQKKYHKSTHEITVTDCWGAFYQGNDEAREHSHYPALWSGVAYIDCPSDSQPTIFPSCNYSHPATEGTYIIFPGWLKHYVKAGSQSRHIVAFNMRALNIV